MNTIRDRLKKDYNIEWSKGFLDKVLKNPFYYGVMIWKKKSYPHKYPPIVTKRLFDDVQAVKSGHNKKRFKYKGKPYFYRGLIKCSECGCQITAEKQKGHVYYHCTQYKGKHGAADVDARLGMLQEADNQYFVSDKYILELSKRAKELIESSKFEQKRKIIKLVLSNLTLEGIKLRYEAVKPFDTILNCADSQSWLEKWYEFGRIDWVSELEYPAWTVKEVGRFLSL